MAKATAASLVFDHAIGNEQLSVAERVAPDCKSEAASARLDGLRLRIRARDAELERLRNTSRRLDWKDLASPLGSVFAASAGCGLIATMISWWIIDRHISSGPLAIAGLWMMVVLLPGIVAHGLLGRRALPDSLVSTRVIGLWAAVAVACVVHGTVQLVKGTGEPFSEAGNQALMLGIGFVAMALQTRRWLLVPGAACFAAGAANGLSPLAGLAIFGGLWVLTMGGVGLAFRLGATLDPSVEEELPRAPSH